MTRSRPGRRHCSRFIKLLHKRSEPQYRARHGSTFPLRKIWTAIYVYYTYIVGVIKYFYVKRSFISSLYFLQVVLLIKKKLTYLNHSVNILQIYCSFKQDPRRRWNFCEYLHTECGCVRGCSNTVAGRLELVQGNKLWCKLISI